MEGYYDYFPLIELDRHLLIGGYLTDENRSVGYRLAALTGLPFADLDRKIEHQARMSVWELILEHGERGYRELESETLDRELKARPFGIVSLGDGALIDRPLRRRVLATANLVSLDLDLANCYWRLKAAPASQGSLWHPLHAGALESIEQVRPYFDRRQPGLSEAPYQIPMIGRSRHSAVARLRELLPQLHGRDPQSYS